MILSSLLEDSYYKISSDNKNKLKKIYYENFVKKNKLQTLDEFNYLYDLMAIQRIFKALGSFAYIYQTRGDIRYIKYMGHSFEKLRDLLFHHKDFYELRVILSEIYYEN